MSDLLFRCPHCLKHLVIDSRAVGKSFDCVNCSTLVRVPEPAVVFHCSSCSTELCAPRGPGGEVFDCPHCEDQIAIPKVMSASEPHGQVDSHHLSQRWTARLKPMLLIFGAGISSAFVFLRNRLKKAKPIAPDTTPETPEAVPDEIPEEEPRPRLRINWQNDTRQGDSTVSQRRLEPLRRLIRKLCPLFKLAGFLLVVGLAAGAALYFMDFGDVADVGIWGNAVQTLRVLGERPGAPDALKDLRSIITHIEDTERNRNARCWLMTVFALGQLGAGNRAEGARVRAYVRNTYPDTASAKMLADANLSDECSRCAAAGEIRKECLFCEGSGKCASCGGSGKWSMRAATPRGRRSLKAPPKNSSDEYFHRIGESLNKEQAPSGPRTCSSCRGTGQCMECRGSGHSSPGDCKLCGGSGQVTSKVRVKAQYDAAIGKALLHALPGQAKRKTTRVLARIQSKIKARVQGTSSAEDSVTDNPLEQVLSDQPWPGDEGEPGNALSQAQEDSAAAAWAREEADVLSDINWGMTRNEVREVKGEPAAQTAGSLTYETAMSDINCSLLYSFDHDRLVKAYTAFAHPDRKQLIKHEDKDGYIRDYHRLCALFEHVYGKAEDRMQEAIARDRRISHSCQWRLQSGTSITLELSEREKGIHIVTTYQAQKTDGE